MRSGREAYFVRQRILGRVKMMMIVVFAKLNSNPISTSNRRGQSVMSRKMLKFKCQTDKY